jgi:hypothetical protein
MCPFGHCNLIFVVCIFIKNIKKQAETYRAYKISLSGLQPRPLVVNLFIIILVISVPPTPIHNTYIHTISTNCHRIVSTL